MIRSLFAAAVVLFALLRPASAEDDPFFISYWGGPPLDAAADARYADVAAAHFTVAGPGASSKESNLVFLVHCQKHGLRALVHDPRLGADPAQPDFQAKIDGVVADYAAHPALYGYFLQDEPNANEFPRLAAVNAQIGRAHV